MPSRRRGLAPASPSVALRPSRLVVGALVVLFASGCGLDATGVEPSRDASSTTGVDASDDTNDASIHDDGGTSDPTRNACGGPGALDGTPGTACGAPGSIWICQDGIVVCAVAPAPLDVRASNDRAEDVLVEWNPPASATPSSYVVRRDGRPLASVGADARRYADATAEAATPGPPTKVEASTGTWSGGVRVTWQAGEGTPGVRHRYDVVAQYEQVESAASEEAEGRRGAPSPTAFSILRDDVGDWKDVGTKTSFEDTTAPFVRLSGINATVGDPAMVTVRVGLTNVTQEVVRVAYRVRAHYGPTVTPATASNEGYRSSGPIAIQWQRSAGPSDAAYSDVPGLTGASWYDDTGPADGQTRYYRARLQGEGGYGVTGGVPTSIEVYDEPTPVGQSVYGLRRSDGRLLRNGRPSSSSEEAFEYLRLVNDSYHSVCGPRRSDGVVVCLSDAPGAVVAQISPGPEELKFAQTSNGCARYADGHLECWIATAGVIRPAPPGTFVDFAVMWAGGCGLTEDGDVRCAPHHYPEWTALELPPGVRLANLVLPQARPCGIELGKRTVACAGPEPWPFPANVDLIAIADGYDKACAIRAADGRLVCQGDVHDLIPDAFATIEYMDYSNVCARRKDGVVRCTGDAVRGRYEGWSTFRAGRMACGLRASDGRTRCDRQWSMPPQDALARMAPTGHAGCGVRASDHTLVCWGSQPFVGADLSGTELSSFGTTCGVRASDSALVCVNRILGDAPGAEPFASLAQREDLVYALRKSDGTLAGFHHPPNVALPSGAMTRVAVGSGSACAIRRSDGAITCWSTTSQNAIVATPPTGAFREVAVGREVVCGIRQADGALACRFGNMETLSQDAYREVAIGANDRIFAIRASDDQLVSQWRDGDAQPRSFERFASITTGTDGAIGAVRKDGHPQVFSY